jgi:hypothetical protein
MKLKLVAAAAVLAAFALPASAAVSTAATNLELLLVAFDGSGATTKDYIRDLGVSVSTIGTSNLTFAAPGSSLFSTAFTGVSSSNIYWNVIAIDNITAKAWTTGSLSALTSAGLGSFDMETNIGNTGGGTEIVPGGLANLVANFRKTPNTEYYGAAQLSGSNGLDLLGNLAGGGGNVISGHGTGTSQNFFQIAGDGTPSQINANAGLLAFDGNSKGGYFTLASDGGLSYTGAATPSAVPLPAAALLFGPGLLGLFGFARKRKAA